MSYEYEVITLNLNEEEQHAIQMGLGRIEDINGLILEVVNEMAKEGWEPLYPFSVPQIWFKRVVQDA